MTATQSHLLLHIVKHLQTSLIIIMDITKKKTVLTLMSRCSVWFTVDRLMKKIRVLNYLFGGSAKERNRIGMEMPISLYSTSIVTV